MLTCQCTAARSGTFWHPWPFANILAIEISLYKVQLIQRSPGSTTYLLTGLYIVMAHPKRWPIVCRLVYLVSRWMIMASFALWEDHASKPSTAVLMPLKTRNPCRGGMWQYVIILEPDEIKYLKGNAKFKHSLISARGKMVFAGISAQLH